MTTPLPNKSYAQAVKTDWPTPRNEDEWTYVTSMNCSWPTNGSETDGPAPRNEDEWTDVASMTDCSWPTNGSDTGETSNTAPHDLLPEQDDPSSDGPGCAPDDGRFERAMHYTSTHLARSKRLYYEIPVCGSDKPWRQVPGLCSRTCRLERQTGAKEAKKQMRENLKRAAKDYDAF